MTRTSATPIVTVLLCAYNAERDIATAIESILGQTFRDFELIIIDDGSTDKTYEIIKKYAALDPRIIKIHQDNTGLTKALNFGIKLSRGQFIARQDADDWSALNRLEKQLDYFKNNPNTVLLGTVTEDVYADGTVMLWQHLTPEEIKATIHLKTPFAHSTAMMRTDILKQLGGYDEQFKTSQDTELWLRFSEKGKIEMLPEALVRRSVNTSSISQRRKFRQMQDALRARLKHRPDQVWPIYKNALRTLIINSLPGSLIQTLKGKNS